jgi:hypothetical protein
MLPGRSVVDDLGMEGLLAERAHVQKKELEWLNTTLGNNPNFWTIVVQHQAISSIAKKS